MLKETILSITEQFHNIGHNGSEVDAMMDSASGMGHRIEEGHDMQGLIEAYELQGIEGIGLWLEHMAKDFTSPHGIPLPFAEAIQEATGMEMDEAIDWLTLNAADITELLIQQGALGLSKNNRKAYHGALGVGSVIGIVDDNPAIIIANVMQYLKLAKRHEKALPLVDKSMRVLNKTGSIISTVCISTAAVDVGLGAMGVNVSEAVESIELMDGFDQTIEAASIASDLIDGAATLGLGFIASKGVKKFAGSVNKKHEIQLEKNKVDLSLYTSLQHQLSQGHSVTALVDYMQGRDLYPKRHFLDGGAL